MRQQVIHPGNFECFMDVYREQVIESHKANPEYYDWPIEDLDRVLGRMRFAIEKNSFNKDSDSFKRTCKQLGIKHTYTAIREFISL